MFTTLGLFAEVPCPEGQKCSLLTCMFLHEPKPLPSTSSSARGAIPKKPRLQSKAAAIPSNPMGSNSAQAMADTTGSPPRATGITEILTKKTSRDEVKLSSAARSISPPPTIRSKAEGATSEKPSSAITPSPAHNPAQLPPRKVRKEPLNPRMLPKSPANHSVRSAILDKLFSTMTSLNEKLIKEKSPTNKCFVLTRDELVTMALDEEEKVAKDNGGLYSNVIKLRIVKLTKMTLDEWTKDVMAHLNARYYKIDSSSSSSPPTSKSIKTGLTVNEEVAVVSALVTPLHGLEEFGYVTRAPTDSDLEIAKKGVAESKGWEKCDRCGGRFQVFPGRREDGALASGGECTYHPDRPIHPPRKRTDNVTGSSESYFPCCGESLGASPGCTKSTTHVFKVSEPKRLASILQFKPTPVQPEKGIMQPVCMDCEMGYTTLGLEMIRLTAVSWPEGHDLLDVLVKPMGEVLDLNSRFSGVFPEHYASATPYGTAVPNANPTEQSKPPLQFVESPAAARELLFGIIQPETPLIGHAIDNDLNVCRIIHPTVIDTVLLYPHPRGRLPYRLGLKALARKFLEREIQTGGDRGHDSKEDSLATGDLVRVKVGEAWNRLKGKGWRIENQSLVPPPGQRPQDAQQTALGFGPGVGQKRKNSTSTG